MHKPAFLVLALVSTIALALTPSPARPPESPRLAETYAQWLEPQLGKAFYVSADATIATAKRRTSAVPAGAREFTLAGIGEDFAWFENQAERVAVPLATLRVVLAD